MDFSVYEGLLWILVRFALWAGLLAYTFFAVIRPWIRNKIFHTNKFIVVIIFGILLALASSYELAAREVAEINYNNTKTHDGEKSRPIRPSTSESLEEKSRRLLKESRESNDKTKDAFNK